jgi:hypothetical protein
MLNLLSREVACRKIDDGMEPGAGDAFGFALATLATELGTGPRRCRVLDLEVSWRRASANLLALGEAAEVAPADIFYPGLRLAMSATGDVLRVDPLFLRLACFSRLTWSAAGVAVRWRTAGHSPASRRVTLARLLDGGGRVDVILSEGLRCIASLRSRVVDASWARELLREHGLPGGLLERLEEAWHVEGAERSRYGVLNALTRLATHASDLPSPLRCALARVAEAVAFGDEAAIPAAA